MSRLPEPVDIRIIEAYSDFQPSFNAKKVVYKLLSTVPGKYLQGLDCVVLLNESGLPRRDRVGKVRSRRRKLARSRIRGLYHPEFHGRLAYIELRIDKICASLGKLSSRIPIARFLVFGHVLFHEIGHHIHHTVRPEHKEKEDVADDWAGKLSANMLRRNYWYLMPILLPVSKLYRLMRRKRWI